MASTEFIAVNWNNAQLMDEDSLDQINNNLLWLKNNSLVGQYQLANSGAISTGLKFLAGKTQMTEVVGTVDMYKDVYFAKAFTPFSSPVVVATPWAHTHISPLNIIGLDGSSTIDHRGFRVHMYSVVNGAYTVDPIINWIAIGY